MIKSIIITLLLSLTLCHSRNQGETPTSMPQKDTYLYFLKAQAEKTNAQKDIDAYHEEIRLIERSKQIFDVFTKRFNLPDKRTEPVDFTCLRNSIDTFKRICGSNNRDLQFFSKFSIACSLPHKPTEAEITVALEEICSSK